MNFIGLNGAHIGLGGIGCLFCSWGFSGIPKIDLE